MSWEHGENGIMKRGHRLYFSGDVIRVNMSRRMR
jgi:hypothetical protein